MHKFKQINLLKKHKLGLILVFGLSTLFWACKNDLDDILLPVNQQTKDFVWRGLNAFYLWQQEVPDLSDARFANQQERTNFLNGYASPEEAFDDLLFQKGVVDKFSVIFNDYRVLEQLLSGTEVKNGMDFALRFKPNSTTDLFGWVRYVMPNSDADNKGVQRGMLFYAINGTPLNTSNFRNLLALNTYTINLADYNNGNITPNGQSITLTKSNFQENPILVHNTHQIGNFNVGYLMYNSFLASFEPALNQVFGSFKNQNITHLVIDLRYNSGGAVSTCTRLASMITGQFTGQVFAQQIWNNKIMNLFESQNDTERFKNRFTDRIFTGAVINSLQLQKVIILTTPSSASASELLINGLQPYIEVIQIGGITAGKNTGSITLYDSPTFTKTNLTPSHRYAMQPLVLKIANSAGFGDYQNGISPAASNAYTEDVGNLGVLGNATEPMLSLALQYISTNGRMALPQPINEPTFVGDSKSIKPLGYDMQIELPKDFSEKIAPYIW